MHHQQPAVGETQRLERQTEQAGIVRLEKDLDGRAGGGAIEQLLQRRRRGPGQTELAQSMPELNRRTSRRAPC